MVPEPRRTQCGETLIESLAAILILSLVAVAAYAGLTTAIRSSAQHRDAGVAESVLRSAAERVQDPTAAYLPLAGCGTRPTYDDLPDWPGGSASVVVTVRFWQPPADVDVPRVDLQFGAPGVCPATDPGLQQIELSVATPSGSVERLDVMKRGNDAAP